MYDHSSLLFYVLWYCHNFFLLIVSSLLQRCLCYLLALLFLPRLHTTILIVRTGLRFSRIARDEEAEFPLSCKRPDQGFFLGVHGNTPYPHLFKLTKINCFYLLYFHINVKKSYEFRINIKKKYFPKNFTSSPATYFCKITIICLCSNLCCMNEKRFAAQRNKIHVATVHAVSCHYSNI
jgi:hypothetical protein